MNGIAAGKKCLALLLAMALSLTASAAFAEAAEDRDRVVRWDRDELVVGSLTMLQGDFFTGMFGNASSDIVVRDLLHGCDLVRWDEYRGAYAFDESVVREVLLAEDDLGNMTYYIALHNDLYYSDGSGITAWDYAFSLLLSASPEVGEIGGKIYGAEHILGFEEYLRGQTRHLSGVRVLDDYQLAITLDRETVPYFFEYGLLQVKPYPIRVIAPGCKVYDDDLGVYIGNEDVTVEAPIYTAELLRETILDPETGYNTHPDVVSGPYTLEAYDGITAHFRKNPFFKGVPRDYPQEKIEDEEMAGDEDSYASGTEGAQPFELVKPSIERIALTFTGTDTMVRDLREGRLDLVSRVVYDRAFREGTQAWLNSEEYPRSGYSFMAFSFERPTVREKEVRQAIAWCMDRDQLAHDYCGEYGQRVDGCYGIGQWEYQMATDETMLPYKLLDKLIVYGVDKNKANALLDYAGWTLDEQGGTYESGETRCKMVDGELIKLDLTLMVPEGNHIVDTLKLRFIDHLNACGIKLTVMPAPMDTLLKSYYRETERTTDMIYLATNMHAIFDPVIANAVNGAVERVTWNNIYTDDAELFFDARNLSRTDPGNTFDYVIRWAAFQERYNKVLPSLPIYSNMYHDLWTGGLMNYRISGHASWAQAILESTFAGRENAELAEREDQVDLPLGE